MLSEKWEGFGERMKRLNPLWMLGSGMRLGSLARFLTTGVILTAEKKPTADEEENGFKIRKSSFYCSLSRKR
jgi:hypothetical protein